MPRLPSARDRALAKRRADQVTIRRIARQAERKSLAAALSGPWGGKIAELRSWMRGMQIGDGRELVDRVEASGLRDAPSDIRALVLGMIADAIGKVRGREGLPPHDDPLPGQPPNAFTACRAILSGGD